MLRRTPPFFILLFLLTATTFAPACGGDDDGPSETTDGGQVSDAGPDGGGEPDGGTGPVVEVCAELAPLPSGTCQAGAGDGRVLIQGTILTPGKIYRGGYVGVADDGAITCVGCDCAADFAGASTLTCPTGVVSPGLINTHDHITFTQNDPYDDTGERYEQRHDWRRGLRGHEEINASGGATQDEIRWGELRFVMGGATSIAGAGSAPGLLRNLDRSAQEGLGQAQVNSDTFPLGDSNGAQLSSGCGYPGIQSASGVADEDAYLPHVSEGIDTVARNEFLCVSSTDGGGQNLLGPQTSIIHGIGLTATDYALLAASGSGLIWSPRSNITLYGDTAEVSLAHKLGVRVALGTDWTPTGSINLLRELRCADQWNRERLDGYFTDEQLWLMVTSDAAAATATDDAIGVLAAGRIADIAIFDGAAHPDHRAVIDAEPDDVVLVMRGGKVLYGDAALVDALGDGMCDAIDVCTRDKKVCLQTEIGKSLAALEAANTGVYDKFFCGEPDNEPSCDPVRPEAVDGAAAYPGTITTLDSDGDGVPDATDNCPRVFNPVRPVDNGAQANADGDAQGDVCDVCPLVADSTTCPTPDPNDRDGDGFANATDNCPNLANPDQADADNDGKGDACDACPMQANPGAAGCQVSIYEIKDGTVAVGTRVVLAPYVVTARNAQGYFLQIKEGDPGYDGADYSGLFIYAPSNTVQVGQRVRITDGRVTNFFGQLELDDVTAMVAVATPEAAPTPVTVTPAEITTGGARAAALEGVVVRVQNATVASLDTTYNEFIVQNMLRVDDFFFLTTPFPTVGQTFAAISGVLAYRNSNSKILPRSAADLVTGPPTLVALEPAVTFAHAGDTAASTFPIPLKVRLSGAALTDTFVAIGSAAPGALAVTGGGVTVAAGQSEATVKVTATSATNGTQLTASLLGTERTATVTVLDGTQQPILVGLTPNEGSVADGGTLELTVTISVPAPPGGTTIAIASDAGTVPSSVVIPADATTASFIYQNGGEDVATVTASRGGVTLEALITKGAPGGLMLNEIDYDQVGNDTAEFVELFNGSSGTATLDGLAVVFCNGAASQRSEYLRVPLSGTLASGGYAVIASGGVSVPGTALFFALTKVQDNIQNGDPDGVALVDTTTNTVVDVLAYEGTFSCTIDGFASPVPLSETTPLPANVADSNSAPGSLSRKPNGTDTNVTAADWAFTSTPTPGTANIP